MACGLGTKYCKNLIPFLKHFLLIYNIVAVAASIVIITMALQMRFDWDTKHYIHELEAYQIWTGPMILMTGAIITLCVALLGFYAIFQEHPGLLFSTTAVTSVAVVLEISGLAYTLDHGTLWSKITPWLEERFFQLMYEADNNDRAARILRIVQEEVGCCGATGWLDYVNLNKAVPHECRDQTTGNMYVFGCAIIFSEWLEPRTGWISGIALGLVVLQLLAIIAMLVFRWAIRREIRVMGHNYNAVQTKI